MPRPLDPQEGGPTRFLPAYDSGDHLHPNDLGYQAMGNAVPLSLFRSVGVTGVKPAQQKTPATVE